MAINDPNNLNDRERLERDRLERDRTTPLSDANRVDNRVARRSWGWMWLVAAIVIAFVLWIVAGPNGNYTANPHNGNPNEVQQQQNGQDNNGAAATDQNGNAAQPQNNNGAAVQNSNDNSGAASTAPANANSGAAPGGNANSTATTTDKPKHHTGKQATHPQQQNTPPGNSPQ